LAQKEAGVKQIVESDATERKPQETGYEGNQYRCKDLKLASYLISVGSPFPQLVRLRSRNRDYFEFVFDDDTGQVGWDAEAFLADDPPCMVPVRRLFAAMGALRRAMDETRKS
jgi:hypothetical protein